MNITNTIAFLAILTISLNSLANTFTTDIHRRYGINSHIMHIPLYLKKSEKTKDKMVGTSTKRSKKIKKKYTRKKIDYKYPKPIRMER